MDGPGVEPLAPAVGVATVGVGEVAAEEGEAGGDEARAQVHCVQPFAFVKHVSARDEAEWGVEFVREGLEAAYVGGEARSFGG